MKWSVDTPIHIGPFRCAAIVEIDVATHSSGPALLVHGEKRPVMVLVLQRDDVIGIDVNGHRCEREEIEHRYPRAIAQVRQHLGKPRSLD